MISRAHPLALAVAHLAMSSTALANMPPPADYAAEVDGNTVKVCPTGTSRSCADNEVMLREDVVTGEVVRLSNLCDTTDSDCHVDECAEAGTYRYGYANPLECYDYAGSMAAYFVTVVVADTLQPSCERSPGEGAPATYELGVPWQNDQRIDCDTDSGGCTSLPGHTGALGLQILVTAAGGVVLLRRRRR